MEVHFPPELEAKLTHSAARQGRNPDELVQDVLTRYFEDEGRVFEAVNRGQYPHGRSGGALVEAMQASPHKEIDLEPDRYHLPVRDAVL